jgi:hypothetical protein
MEMLASLNASLETIALSGLRRLTRSAQPLLLLNNHDFQRLLVDGIPVDYKA